MDAFVRRLVERLHDPKSPLSRNRHFHTFQTPDGQRALRTSRRLLSLQRDILGAGDDGVRVSSRTDGRGRPRVELSLELAQGRRTTLLEPDEFELLSQLPGVRERVAPR